MTIGEVAGWIGFLLLLAAYLFVSLEKIKPRYVFQIMNIVGALFVGISALEKQAYPAVALEGAWIAIALIAIIRILLKPQYE